MNISDTMTLLIVPALCNHCGDPCDLPVTYHQTGKAEFLVTRMCEACREGDIPFA